jgi:RND family efflux transporter MFP subunit
MASSNRLLWPAVGAALGSGLILGVIVTVAVVALTAADPPEEEGGGPPPGGAPPAAVRVGQVDIRKLQHRVPVIGRLREVRRVTVTSEIEGRIVDLAVEVGDTLEAEQTVIAQIDETWANLRLTSATAAVAEARAALQQSESDLRQLEQLSTAGSARPKEVEDGRTRVATDQARLEAAVADRDRAQTEARRARVVAPFDGAVSQKLAEVGQWVDPGDGIVEVISIGQIDAVIDVPERLVGKLAIGDEIEVRIEAVGESMIGRVAAVRPDGSNASRTFPVQVRLKDPEQRLRAGMSVVAEVPVLRESEYITVPRDAVLFNATGAAVWFSMPMGQPMPAAMSEPVEVLFGVGDRYAVAPLPGGERPVLTQGTPVVVEGAERLWPTRPLQVLNPADPPAGEPEQAETPDPATPTPAGA